MGIFDFLKKNKNIENDNGLNEIYYDNGKSVIQSLFYKKDGRIHGELKKWYDNSQIRSKINYNDGKKEGLFQSWYKDGQLEFEGIYKDGKKEGLMKSWFQGGELKCEVNYRDGEIVGITKQFYSNKNLRLKIVNPENHFDRKYKYTIYRKDGTKKIESFFRYIPPSNSSSNIRFFGDNHLHSRYAKNNIWSKSNSFFSSPSGYFPFGKWNFFNIKGVIEYELDFTFHERYGQCIQFLIKNNLDDSGNKISTEILEIIAFNSKYFRMPESILNRGNNLYNIEPNLLDKAKYNIFETCNLEIDTYRLLDFCKSEPQELIAIAKNNGILKLPLKHQLIYAFSNSFCLYKLMFEIMMIFGGIDTFKQLDGDTFGELESHNIFHTGIEHMIHFTKPTMDPSYKEVWENHLIRLTYEIKRGLYSKSVYNTNVDVSADISSGPIHPRLNLNQDFVLIIKSN